ncbi:MAG: sigma-54 dependent transcriptional regulator [Candidatus Eisenbacteria bacterium]|uniref:Sigma-54 dependent transcriptional regulator n=1 Tax=Eiseniibacteriota bacterium TaxID=2212470 RepID=A0A948S1V1_UNCEI|nr:sigma-54 dependent transcriptional regulator [Candidatus Eisenbacteria bacterium]MBU1947424.1 sigma-54 dependent transcriptional regulator [Candidatus Eisenbacteria bacterium]MBU2693387.1 sigma-54 dependent transcriptional regulator [Candidatus Eisenbacteria bacterium]
MTTNTEGKGLLLNILVVDDEANIRKTLSYCLVAEGHSVISVSNPADALEEARRRSFDLAFVDLKLGVEDGMELIPVLLSDSPWTKIVVITAHASIESVVEAMRRGATDYIAKPFTPDQVKLLTQRISKIRELETELAALKEDMQRLGPEDRLQSKNAGMQRVIETARKAAPSEAIVLLQGESGTGKSVFARAIHHWSPRKSKPLGVVACPSVPSDLLESELFGHIRGAFTGAVRDNPGRIAACEGGTLLLDEIGDIAPAVQAKLLRFIQDKEYERVGDAKSRRADVRIIAATNANLEERVAEGRFREDLFYRLNVISLTIPPLRERPEDIMPLATDFLAHFCRVNHKRRLGFTAEAESALTNHPWPGNIRELRNTIERAVILGSGEQVGKSDLPNKMSPATGTPAIGEMVPMSTIEELHIRRILAITSSLQEAADVLGMDQATLWRRRRTYGI